MSRHACLMLMIQEEQIGNALRVSNCIMQETGK